jgi:hypothetical protein
VTAPGGNVSFAVAVTNSGSAALNLTGLAIRSTATWRRRAA